MQQCLRWRNEKRFEWISNEARISSDPNVERTFGWHSKICQFEQRQQLEELFWDFTEPSLEFWCVWRAWKFEECLWGQIEYYLIWKRKIRDNFEKHLTEIWFREHSKQILQQNSKTLEEKNRRKIYIFHATREIQLHATWKQIFTIFAIFHVFLPSLVKL